MYTIKEGQRGGEMTIDQVDRGWGPALAWARGAGAAVGAEVPVIWFPTFGRRHHISIPNAQT